MHEGYGYLLSLTLGACARVLRYLLCHSFVLSIELQRPSLTLELGKGMNRFSTTMACNVTRRFFRFHLNFRTALRVRRHLKKKPVKAYIDLLSVHGHAHMTHLVVGIFWLAVQFP